MPGIHMIRLEACMSVHSCTSPSSSFPIRLFRLSSAREQLALSLPTTHHARSVTCHACVSL